jgi:hypothetical protein
MIREGRILKIEPGAMQLKGEAISIYYEVCTHPKVFQRVQQLDREEEEKLKFIQS